MRIFSSINTVLFFLLLINFAQASNLPRRDVQIRSADELFELFEQLDYTQATWEAGIRLIPRIYITDIPQRWQDNSPKMPVLNKKQIFFRLIAPLALASNEKIIAERERLLQLDLNKSHDRQWLAQLASKYRLSISEDTIDNSLIDKLKTRVDIIPISLVLAQAAEESGWGTSRFTVQGNALFGQWDFSGKGMKPKQQRKELGDYGIARFDTPLKSVQAYMHNLNTHKGYQRLRDARATMHTKGKLLSGYELANALDKYSERGIEYVKSIQGLMRHNKLSSADEAILTGDEVIYIKP